MPNPSAEGLGIATLVMSGEAFNIDQGYSRLEALHARPYFDTRTANPIASRLAVHTVSLIMLGGPLDGIPVQIEAKSRAIDNP